MKTARLQVFVCIVLLFSFFNPVSGQTRMFNHFKSVGEKIVVYFTIEGLSEDASDQNNVLTELLYDSNISDGNIYFDAGQSKCQLVITPNIGVDYIENILQNFGYSIDESSLAASANSTPEGFYYSQAYSFFSGFDGFKDYDINDPESKSREEHYNENKEKWIQENKEEYQKAKEQTGSTVIVKRKDLEFFKEEKRNYILDHPEIFIIED
jgi:hypothetical protein